MTHDGFELGLHDINNAGIYAIGNDDVAPCRRRCAMPACA